MDVITYPCSELCWASSLQWRHNKRNGVSNLQCLDCLLNRLFRRRSKKTSKIRVTGLCEGNPPVTGGFPSQRASNAENVSILWRHHAVTGDITRIVQGYFIGIGCTNNASVREAALQSFVKRVTWLSAHGFTWNGYVTKTKQYIQWTMYWTSNWCTKRWLNMNINCVLMETRRGIWTNMS